MVDDSQLVQHLLQRGIIDQESLLKGVELQKENDLSLYETLVKHDLVTENEVVDVVAQLLSVPFVQLDSIDISPTVSGLVPPSMARRNRVIPIQVRNEGSHRQLILGMVDPIDVMAMDEISSHTGIDIRPVLVGPSAFRAKLKESIMASKSDDDSDDIFDGFDEIAVDVLDDENWEDFFDSAEGMGDVEDSSVISTEMRDRPGSDVFDAVDDVPSLDELEMTELNQPVDPESVGMLADLDDWEIDDAITSNAKTKNRPRAEIVSANDANSLFDEDDPRSHADLESEAEDLEDDYADEPTQRKTVEELEAELKNDARTNTLDPDSSAEDDDSGPPTGNTAVGVGPDESSGTDAGAAYQTRDSDTSNLDDPSDLDDLDSGGGQTQAGIGARALAEATASNSPVAGTDWGALGRKILKTGDESEASDQERESEEEQESEEGRGSEEDQDTTRFSRDSSEATATDSEAIVEPDGETNDLEAGADPELAGVSEPDTREITENDLKDLTESAGRTAKETAEYKAVSRHEGQGLAPNPRDTPVAGTPDARNLFEKSATRPAVAMPTPSDPEADDTRPRALSDIAQHLELELDDGITDRHLMVAVIKLLIAQGILSKDELADLAKNVRDTEA